jgi:hypothetical protein
MLARRLIVAIFEPRIGVLKNFKAGDMGQVSNAILWSTLRALDVGVEIKRVGFANHALVSAELVKFLTVNSGVEAIEQLQNRVDILESNMADAIKDIKSANKAAASASNKADLTATSLAALEKRVRKLE